MRTRLFAVLGLVVALASPAFGEIVWVFAVDVSEMWHVGSDRGVIRSIGGWTHNGPYKTRAECEKAREEMLQKPYTYHDASHTRWDKPRACRTEDGAAVKALREAEMQTIRGRR